MGLRDFGWKVYGTVTSKADLVTFYDMGPYYEIWQKNRETGRPLVVQDGYLQFVQGATPGKSNIEDATWG